MEAYETGQQSFLPHLLPATALQLPVYQVLELLTRRYGYDRVRQALDPNHTVESPVAGQTDGGWLKRANVVGVNVRTIGSFWNVINYTLTLPAIHDSIHLLPIWEPGVVGSLYGIVSWQINPEFFSQELYGVFPGLESAEKQLKVVINLLHLMGRTVGMDVIPHTDRFSEIVLCHPELFEWVRREGSLIVDSSESVTDEVKAAICEWAAGQGVPADAVPDAKTLFGEPHDYVGRLSRRLSLIWYLVERGYETLPMTMAPPYRGLRRESTSYIVDEYGQKWYEYAFEKPQAMSRVFGPLTRYKFYHPKNDNQNGELDFDRPNEPAWTYVQTQFVRIQQQYGFDFMRGDMAHVQMRPTGVPAHPDAFYDPLRAIKQAVRRQAPYFGFFGETFLAPPDYMGYGDEIAHLEAIDADSTLGDLQSVVVGSLTFMQRFRQYVDLAETRRFAPNFTVMTADKDDPRFDEFYRTGNVFRYFVALFLPCLPSYVGLGFETRNLHRDRGRNEEYTKLYVFQIRDVAETDKVTSGPFIWGENHAQFTVLTQLRLLSESMTDVLLQHVRWLIPPDPTGDQPVVAWTQAHTPAYVFVANANQRHPARHVTLPLAGTGLDRLTCLFDSEKPTEEHEVVSNGTNLPLPPLAPGACRVYRVGEGG